MKPAERLRRFREAFSEGYKLCPLCVYDATVIMEIVEAARREGAEEAERKLDIALGCLTDHGKKMYDVKLKEK